MDEVKLKRAIIKLTGIFPEEMELVREWLKEVQIDAIRGAAGHKEDGMALRFLGRYTALEDVLNYMAKALGRQQ